MANCINKSLPEFKALAKKAGINPIILAAKIGVWQTENNKIGVFPKLSQLPGLENFTQVNYNLKSVDVLTKPEAEVEADVNELPASIVEKVNKHIDKEFGNVQAQIVPVKASVQPSLRMITKEEVIITEVRPGKFVFYTDTDAITEVVGYAEVNLRKNIVEGIKIAPAMQEKGLGTKFYQNLIDRNILVQSSPNQKEGGTALWKGLVEKGLAVKVEGDTYQLVSKSQPTQTSKVKIFKESPFDGNLVKAVQEIVHQELIVTKDQSDIIKKIDDGTLELSLDYISGEQINPSNKLDQNTEAVVIHAGGEVLGMLGINSKTVRLNKAGSVAGMMLNEGLHKRGLTTKLYLEVNNKRVKEGKVPLKSDQDLSESSLRLWEGLVRKGHAKVIGKSVIDPGQNVYQMISKEVEEPTQPTNEEKAQEEIFLQTESKENQEANEEIDQAMSNFLKSIGVKLEAVSEIRDKNGKLIDAVAKADMIKKVVQVVNGKASIDTLPEEAAHFFVELLEADGNPLFDSMMNNIEGYSVYDEVVNDPRYQEAYKGDETKLKKEAVGKLIAQQLVKNLQGKDSPAKMKRANTWFERVMQAIRKFFSKASRDPYSRGAYIMLSEKVSEYLNVEDNIEKLESGEYYEMSSKIVDDPRKTVEQKLDETIKNYESATISAEKNGFKEKWIVEEGSDELQRYVGRVGSPFEGVIIRGRVSDEVKKHFINMRGRGPETEAESSRRKEAQTIRMETGTAGHNTLEDLINLKTNNLKTTKAQILANSPFNKAQLDTLSKGVDDIVKQVNEQQDKINKKNGTKGKAIFRTEQIIINTSKDTGGTIDLLVLFNDGSAAVYDYKFVSPSIEAGYVDRKTGKIVNDPFAVKMDTYNIQIGAYKQTLLNEYGVTKVRQSRIVPIHIRYEYNKEKERITRNITKIQMGIKYSQFLEQIPVAEEMTDFEKINDVITKLIIRKKNVEDRLKNKNFQVGETFEKAKLAKETMEKQLRKLQLNQDVAYVLNGLKKDLKDLEKRVQENEPLTEKGEPNPDYLTLDELNDLNNDLIFYRNLLGLDDYMTNLRTEDPAKYAKTIKIQEEVGTSIMIGQSMVETKIRDRVADNARERGIKGIEDYNPSIDYMTGAFVTLSKQNNPFLRNLYGIVDELNYDKRKAVKVVAAEIQRLQDAVLAQSSTPGSIKAFDPLINNATGNFVPKFQKEFYESRDKAIQEGNSRWFEENTVINQESYDKKFKGYRDNKKKLLKRKFTDNNKAIERELLAWDKQHDIVKHFKTASVSLGGKYFLKADEKFLTSEYLKIQSNPALKEFYEYYQDKIRVIEEMFGKSLGTGFIAEIQKEFVESQQADGFFNKKGFDSIIEKTQVREHDLSLGMRDDNTGKLIRKIPKLFITPVTDSNGNVDPSLKSRDLGKGLLLLFDAALDYQMKMEVMPEVMAMEQLLKDNTIKEIDTDAFGNVIPTLSGITRKLFETRNNADVFTGYVDQYFFGNTVGASDIKIGKTSAIKTALQLKQFHSLISLGLKVPVAAGAFFAGQFGLYQQASKNRFITVKSLKTSQAALMKADPKMRAIAEYFDMYQRDDAKTRANKLSANYVTRHLTNDKWFSFLSTADRGIDATISHSVAQNMGLDPDTNEIKRLSQLPEGTKSILDLMEIKENPQWKGTAGNVSNKAVDRYIVTMPGMTKKQELEFRNTAKRVSDKVKGTMSDEDIALYNNTLLMRFMMHYKSWLPGVAMERFGKQRYDQILKTFDEGTWISTFNNMGVSGVMNAKEALDKEVGLLGYLGQTGKDIVRIGIDVATFGLTDQFKVKEDLARAKFEQWVANNKDNPEFTERLKDPEQKEEMFKDFVDMKRGNIKANIMEMRLTMLFMLLLMVMGGDYDDDGKIDIRQSRAGRKLYAITNRTYRELAVFTQPQEFLESGRATGIPLLTLGGQLFKLSSNTLDEMRDDLLGEDSNRDKTQRFHYTFKMLPGLNALTKTLEYSESDKNSRT